MRTFKYSILVALIPIITACGGGGSDSPSVQPPASASPAQPVPPPAALSLSIDTDIIVMDENSNTNTGLSVTYNGDKALSFSVDNPDAATAIRVEDETINITSSEVDGADVAYSFIVHVTDGVLTDSVNVDLTIENTSLPIRVDELKTELARYQDFINSIRIVPAITDYFIDIAALTNALDESSATSLQQSVNRISDAAYVEIELGITDIENELNTQVSFGEITDSAVISMLSAISIAENEFIRNVNIGVAEATNPIANLVPSVTVSQFYSQPSNGTLSLYIGNPLFGETSNGTFTFYEQYQFMQSIMERNANICTNIIPETSA